jgi:hypothetical protein
MDIILMYVVCVVCLVLGAIVLTLSINPSGKKEHEKPIHGTSFVPSQIVMSNDGLGGIAVDDRSLQICLLKNTGTPPRLLPLTGLVGAFLIKNGEIIGEGLRTFPHALLSFQHIMHSNVERLIKSWQTTSTPKDNQRIDLIVLVHDEHDPLHVVNLLDMETKNGGILYEKALGAARHWQSVLEGLILQADHHARLQAEPDQGEPTPPSASVADEMEKLNGLVEKQIMTP